MGPTGIKLSAAAAALVAVPTASAAIAYHDVKQDHHVARDMAVSAGAFLATPLAAVGWFGRSRLGRLSTPLMAVGAGAFAVAMGASYGSEKVWHQTGAEYCRWGICNSTVIERKGFSGMFYRPGHDPLS
jgi:hypothetical protein